jgi:hypothetical protein
MILVCPGDLTAQYAPRVMYPLSGGPSNAGLLSPDTVSRSSGLLIEVTLSFLGAAAVSSIASVASDNEEVMIGAFGTGAIGGALLGGHAVHRRPSLLGSLLGGGIPTLVAILLSANATNAAESGEIVPIVTLTAMSIVGAVWGSHAAWR